MTDIAFQMDPFGKRPIDHLLNSIYLYEEHYGRKPTVISVVGSVWSELRDDAKALGVYEYFPFADLEKVKGVRVHVRWDL